MKDTYVNAKLVAPSLIRLVVFSSLPWEKISPTLYVDGVPSGTLIPSKTTTVPTTAIVDFQLKQPLELGHSYFLSMPQYGSVPLDVTEATTFPDFDRDFTYEGDDLGCTYGPKFTKFALWAPLAGSVMIGYFSPEEGEENIHFASMTRSPCGVYRYTIKGNAEGYRYIYLVRNSEFVNIATDPYAKASTQNGTYSVVADFSKLTTDFHRDALPIMNAPTDAIVYEAHVRDMTISSHTNIKHKGTFKGLTEPERKSALGMPAGFDYICSLGITHLQLLPIYDYKTVDETNPTTKYNWGYDPAQFFVPEGSYASDLADPLSRIKDLKEMVAAFHEKGIRIVMDVVYNHVYEYQDSVFEKVVPNYYFRHARNGKISSCSGCGDDLATERPMVRKLIVDCCKWWIDTYGIDGFRFDLMGLIDIDTLNQIADYGRKKDRNFILYGEGWDMAGDNPIPMGKMGNYRSLPRYGFFNDFYRETAKRYFSEPPEDIHAFKACFAGCCNDFIVGAKFLNANQTINYVECHDNATFYDYLSARRRDLSEMEKMKIVQMANAAILLSCGIPFIHMGQEIGQSKFGEENTFNKGDHFNKFSYALLEERKGAYNEFIRAVKLRKKKRFLHLYDPKAIDINIEIGNHGDVFCASFAGSQEIAPKKRFDIFVNPSSNDVTVPLYRPNGDYKIILDTSGGMAKPEISPNSVLVPARTLVVVEG